MRRNGKKKTKACFLVGAPSLCCACVCVCVEGIPLGDFGGLDTWLQREKAC